jgi:TetR/AcrR family transcriptional regulator, lmrAB and yxaGH operons repressor
MLTAAIDLIRGYGLSGAGINDLVRASGAPKGSVYHFFAGGKSQIASEALAAYAVDVRAFIDQALGGPETPRVDLAAISAGRRS